MSINIRSKNITHSIDFWQNTMSFYKITENLLHFHAPVATWSLDIVIKYKKDLEKPYLDDGGLSCISFLVRDIQQCMQSVKKLETKFMSIGDSFSINVNNKDVKAFFARGPQEELLEFVSIF